MFKKSLIALAMTTAAFNASATLAVKNTGELVANAGKGELVSVEGTVAGSAVALADITATASTAAATAATYSSFNGLTVELVGATFNPATALTVNVNDGTAGSALTLTTHYTVAFKTSSRAEITLTAAGKTLIDGLAGSLTDGNANVFTIGGIQVNAADIKAATGIKVSVEADSNIPGTDLETGSGVVATGQTQFATTVTKTSSKIDVAQERKYFADAAKDASDSFKVKVSSVVVEKNRATTTASQKIAYTIKGDFKFLDADNDGKLDTGTSISVKENGTTAAASQTVLAADLQSLVFTSSAPSFTGATAQNNEIEVIVTTDGTRLIPENTFTAATSMPYTAGITTGTHASGEKSAGTWTLNGDTTHVSFMPFGPAYSQSVTLSNTGVVDGDITIDWFYNGTKTTTKLAQKAMAKSVTDISNELREVAKANNITGNASFNIVVNSPDGNIKATAVYYAKADADRAVMAAEQ